MSFGDAFRAVDSDVLRVLLRSVHAVNLVKRVKFLGSLPRSVRRNRRGVALRSKWDLVRKRR